jgi:radical SAM superfamily enzyme YgiQ (UPF0313 family)
MISHAPAAALRRFQLILIKPSHYDDDGYVIRWWRTLIPSNSLAALYGLVVDAERRQVLGPDVAFDIEVLDETNTRVNIRKLINRFQQNDNFGMVGLVGVQSNQYPRALDIARPFREAGIQVALGGFHAAGCIAMLDGKAVDLDSARGLGISIVAGEAEEHLDELLRDAAAGALKLEYDFMKSLPNLGGTPIPFLPHRYVKRNAGVSTTFDAGRGCPFQCSFCTIINVQGRKSRYRSPDDIEKIVLENWAQGISKFFITDDNFARNREWESIFDRLAKLREVDKIPIGFMIQVDTACHKIPNFITKAQRAGVTRVFLGLENINPDNLKAAKKPQNKITEYRRMLQEWKARGIFTYAGYILGLPSDTPESIRRDISIMQRELPIDILEFVVLTPLPGSEDHKKLWQKGVAMDADLNKYDLEHAVTDHPNMTRAEMQAIYNEAWDLYYTPAHVETLLRRAAANDVPLLSFVKVLVPFMTTVQLEKVHPLQAGILRLQHPSERRPGLPREHVLAFYPRFIGTLVTKTFSIAKTIWWIWGVTSRIKRDPAHRSYTDGALTPTRDDDEETLDLLTKTSGVREALAHQHKIERLTHAVRA